MNTPQTPISPQVQLREIPGRLKGVASLCHNAAGILSVPETPSPDQIHCAAEYIHAIILRAQDIHTDLLRIKDAFAKEPDPVNQFGVNPTIE